MDLPIYKASFLRFKMINMKNHKLYFIIAMLFVGFFACKKNDTEPVLILNSPPVFTNPTGGDNLFLSQADEANPFEFSWTAADFNLKNLSNTSYKLQMDVSGNNFAEPLILTTTTELSYLTTVKRFNNVLLGTGLDPDQATGIDIRIDCDIDGAYVDTTEVLSLTVTPYTDVVDAKPIYLLGSATAAGWDNMAALEMTFVDGKFEIVAELTPGADQYIKFISTLGQWAPQWGTDDNGVWSGGTLVYRPDEATPDPASIPAPDFAGQFKIIADTVNLTYEVFEYGDIYLLGDATVVGWDNTKAIPMVKVAEGKYTLTTTLAPGAFWKIIEERGQWAPQWGTDDNGAPEGGNLVFRPDETAADPPAMPSPGAEGLYKIEVDIVGLTYSVTPQ